MSLLNIYYFLNLNSKILYNTKILISNENLKKMKMKSSNLSNLFKIYEIKFFILWILYENDSFMTYVKYIILVSKQKKTQLNAII